MSTDMHCDIKPRSLFFLIAMAIFHVTCMKSASAEAMRSLQGLSPLNAAELESYCGGFLLPNGVSVNVGIETDISINGSTVVHSQFSTGPIVAQNTLPAISAQLQNVGGVMQILQLANGQTTLINNTMSQALIQQLQTITIDIANFPKFNAGAVNGMIGLRSQALNGLRMGLH